MKIRNIEVDFNFLNADDIERFEKEADKIRKECQTIKKQNLSYSQAIREECRIINNFFDNVFGEGVSEKIFGNKDNLEEHIKVFEDVVKEKINQQKGFESTLERYQPNREQRRYNQYHNKGRR